MDTIVEIGYPLTFREDDVKLLGDHVQHFQSVELVGMKRVGISNFLRFFLFHKDIQKTYMRNGLKHFFILIDLNDLIEREVFPFWRLAFKRIADAVESGEFPDDIKKKISSLFVASIQSGDLFLTFDGVKEALSLLNSVGVHPVLFLSRFDRLKDVVTPEFFDNLQSLKDATNQKLSYIFTSYRGLDALAPKAFPYKEVALFAKSMYIKPAEETDSKSIFNSFARHYGLTLSDSLVKSILQMSGGHVQYLQLALVVIHELGDKRNELFEPELIEKIAHDERIAMQSEELWESLSNEEQDILRKVVDNKELSSDDEQKGKYLWDTGFIKNYRVFSSFFETFVKSQNSPTQVDTTYIELSKKEYMLLELLKLKPNEITEREDIVEKVWPEYKEYGVSDWSIDRLVARLRSKLKQQKAPYEIQTIRTRGYKLLAK